MMSEAKLDPVWVTKELLPARATIKNVQERILKTKRGDYTAYDLDVEIVTVQGLQIFNFIAAYGDKNFLVNTIAPQPEKWIGKQIGLVENEKGYTSISS
jgi:hypothetical protein